MSNAGLGTVLRHLKSMAGSAAARHLPDGHLLEQFCKRHDQAAFAALVQRHGRLVWAVCWRLLRHEQDCEDCFQATFLALAQTGGAIRQAEALASWLHGVAYRICMRVRRDAARRRVHEARVQPMPAHEPTSSEAALREIQALLDEEVCRLPVKYRAPFVLCCLEGKTRKEAAEELGWKDGTVSSRLAEARRRLQVRLARRGVALSAALCAMSLSQGTAGAVAPPALATATVAVACARCPASVSARVLTLARAAWPTLAMTKLKMAAGFVLLAGMLLASAGFVPGPMPAESSWSNAESNFGQVGDPPDALGMEPHPRNDWQGDPLPAGAVARMGSVRLRHVEQVNSVALSPDGKIVASESNERFGVPAGQMIRLWDAATGKQLHQLQGPWGSHQSLAFSPDGQFLFVGTSGTTVHALDVRTKQELWRIPGRAPIALSADGKLLAVAGNGKTRRDQFNEGRPPQDKKKDKLIDPTIPVQQRIQLWDVAEHRPIRGFTGEAFSLALSPDGRLLAAALEDRQALCVWDLKTGDELLQFHDHGGYARVVAFSPDSKTLAAAGGSAGEHWIWEVATGREIWRHKENFSAYVLGLAFSPDAQLLVSTGSMAIRFWDAKTGKELPRPAGQQHYAVSVAFCGNGKTLVSGSTSGTVRLWDVATGRPVLGPGGHQAELSAVAISPDSKVLATGSHDQTIRLWEMGSGKELAVLQGQGIVASMAFSPDGQELLSRSDDGKTHLARDWNMTYRAWKLATAQPRQLRHMGFDYQAVLSPDGKWLARATDDAVRIEDTATEKEVRRFGGPPGTPFLRRAVLIAFSRDGRRLAAQDWEEAVQIWDTGTGKEICRFGPFPDSGRLMRNGEPGSVFFFSRDGKILVTRSSDRSLSLWEVATGKRLRRFPREMDSFIHVALSPDGRALATTGHDTSIYIWEVLTGRPRRQFKGHLGRLAALAFSPDGKLLVSAGMDSTALVWDVTGQLTSPKPGKPVLSRKELERLWTELSAADAAKSNQAARGLLLASEQAVPFLREHLRPVPHVAESQLKNLIADLSNEHFAVRQQATRQLEELEESAAPALQAALASRPALEARQRIEGLLRSREPASRPTLLRGLRAIEVLEQVGSPQAREALQALAKGAPMARLTQDAKASLDRLTEQRQGN